LIVVVFSFWILYQQNQNLRYGRSALGVRALLFFISILF